MGKSLIIPGADFSANSISKDFDDVIDLFDLKQTLGYFVQTSDNDNVLFLNTKLKSQVYSLQISLTNPISFNEAVFDGFNKLIIKPKEGFLLFTATGYENQNAKWNEGSNKENQWTFIENDQAVIDIIPDKYLAMFVSISKTAEDDMSMYNLIDIIDISLL